MTLALPRVDRRTLLVGGGVGIGLVVAWLAWPREPANPLRAGEGERAFNAFLKIGRDGRVTVAVPQAETGQGAWTALPQIAADELGAAWELVAVEPAPLAPVYANPRAEEWLGELGSLRAWRLPDGAGRLTARSSSVRAFEQPLRQAAAAARAMLIAAAADRWGVAAAECDATDGFVVHEGKRLGFGELAEEAARLDPPEQMRLRQPGTGALIGRALPRLDLPAKTDGSLRFAGDVRLPDMLFAAARLAPPGGRLTAFSRAAAMDVPGVREIAADRGWLAVAADTGWAAERALRAANPHFEAPSGGDVRALCEAALLGGDLETHLSRGDYSNAIEGSRPLAATYWAAPAMHLGLEPLSATARLSSGRLEVWAPTQAPEFARAAAARAVGGSASHVTLYPMPIGDSSGRALEADAIPIAVELARRLGRPVQLTLSATSSQNHDRLSPPALARLAALPGASGGLAAWRMQLATADGFGSALARLAGHETAGLGQSALTAAMPPYAIPNVRIDAVAVEPPFAIGYMRGRAESALTFFIESFVDELARAAGIEPLAYRMAMLSGQPRLARCIATAASAGGWDGGTPGSTMGLACCAAYGSFIGLLAEASIGGEQRIVVHRLVAAVDCGRIANAGLVRQQVESGLLWALGQASAPEPVIAAGIARARPLTALGLPRLAGTPAIQVELIPSGADPGGVSGLAPAVLAPALANAIAAGTGRRLRQLPLDPMSAE